MKLEFTPEFIRDFAELSASLKLRTSGALDRLKTDIQHPGLRVKKMKGYRNIWEARISKSYRMTFEIREDRIIMRRVGEHDIEKNP